MNRDTMIIHRPAHFFTAATNILDSIQNQNGCGVNFQIELIVVDDCSTDSTVQILTKIVLKREPFIQQ